MEQGAEAGAPRAPVIESKQKSGNGLKIVTAIACIVAVCGIGFGVYGMVQGPQKDNDGNIEIVEANKVEANDDSNAITITDDTFNEDEEVKAIIEKISNVVDDYMGNTHFVKTFNELMPHWKIADTDVFVDMGKSYGIYSGIWAHSKETQKKLFSVHKTVETFLENNGYTRNDDLPELPIYYNEKTQIVCELYEGSESWNLGCAKTDWVSEDKKRLAIELAEASGIYYLDLSSIKIIDSVIAPYQRLIMSGSSAMYLFYRISSNDKWQFITGTQDLVGCDKFNDDAKKAYAGEKCWDATTNTEKTL